MTPVTPSIMKCLKSCAPDVHYLLEPVQLLYVLMFSVSLIHMDKIYVDKVCQVNLKDWIESKNLTIDVCNDLTGYEMELYSHQGLESVPPGTTA